jgi:hypothetical protein
VPQEAYVKICLRREELVSILLPWRSESGKMAKKGQHVRKLRVCGEVSNLFMDAHDLVQDWLFVFENAQAVMKIEDDAGMGNRNWVGENW